eukprot:g25767.t1
MVLDVDEQNGRGPETISFKNVPPGLYQVVVNQWTTTGRSVYLNGRRVKVEDVSWGNPRVNLYIGGNSIRFECEISDACRMKSRVWNVLNIKVEDAGPLEGSTPDRYYNQKKRWVYYSKDSEGQDWFYKATQGNEYTDEYLESVCYGECEPAEPEFKDCLARDSSRRLARNHSKASESEVYAKDA